MFLDSGLVLVSLSFLPPSPCCSGIQEPARLKRLLISLGLPSAGTVQKLQQRALAVSSAVCQEGLSLEQGVERAKKLR